MSLYSSRMRGHCEMKQSIDEYLPAVIIIIIIIIIIILTRPR